jgi:hypothetical protein
METLLLPIDGLLVRGLPEAADGQSRLGLVV